MEDRTPYECYHNWRLGWNEGSQGIHREPHEVTGRQDLVDAYWAGHAQGLSDRNRADSQACKYYGYKPNILRQSLGPVPSVVPYGPTGN